MLQSHDDEPRKRVAELVAIWAHNRSLYPGWLVFPTGQERFDLSWRTDEWELPILNALPELGPVDRLKAIRELMWRKEILLEPITPDLEDAAMQSLQAIDCLKHTIEGVDARRDDWVEIREAWVSVTLSLVTDARFDCDLAKFEQRLDTLRALVHESPSTEHRIHQERCLWATYSMDYDLLNDLLDGWTVENCDPVWMLRKAALLTEVQRYDDSASLVQKALTLLRHENTAGRSIAGASREGWALASTLTMTNQRSISREWDRLASLKCDAGAETGFIRRAMLQADRRSEGPSFDLGTRRGTSVHFSTVGHDRVIAAYRAVRLPEVAGLPLATNPAGDGSIPMSMVSDLLASAAEEVVKVNPRLAMRLVLRICKYDGDRTLQRVFSRVHLAGLSEEALAELARICIALIRYALRRLLEPDKSSDPLHWVERLRAALEILSRLVLRLPPDMVNEVLSLGLDCYRTDGVAQHVFLGNPLDNLFERTWGALSAEHRTNRVLDLLSAPILGLDGFVSDTHCPDPGRLVSEKDLPPQRTSGTEGRYQETVSFLTRGLLGADETRKRATLRLIPLVLSHSLTTEESAAVGKALWNEGDAVLHNPSTRSSPFDWVYFLLPEVVEGQAENSFRIKWLTPERSSEERGTDYSSEMLAQVGAAVSALREWGSPLALSAEDQEHIAAHIERLVERFSADSGGFSFGIGSTIGYVGPLAAEIRMPAPIANNLFRRLEFLLGIQSRSQDPLFGHLGQIRIALGYAVIPGLVKVIPEQLEAISLRLRTGLASEDDRHVRGAMSALGTWLSSTALRLRPVPDDLIREVGAIIAAGRRGALVDALVCAVTVFDRGTQSHRDTMMPLALQGLSYLAEKLRYQPEAAGHDDVPTLRFLCAQLATKMVPYGSESDATLAKWLNIGLSDPFPDTRGVVTAYGAESQFNPA